jgi:hypothetical protein
MPWSFDFMATHQVLLVTISAPFTEKDLKPMIIAALEELSKRGSLRCLVDYRASGFRPTVMDLYKRPDLYEQLGVPHSARLEAVIGREFTDSGFAEDVVQNRGYKGRFFDSVDAAIRWLSEGPQTNSSEG